MPGSGTVSGSTPVPFHDSQVLPGSSGESVKGTHGCPALAVNQMGINHRCIQVRVTEKALNGSDIAAVLQQVSGKTVTKGVEVGSLQDARLDASPAYGPLENRHVDMPAAPYPSTQILEYVWGREYKLPAKILACVGHA